MDKKRTDQKNRRIKKLKNYRLFEYSAGGDTIVPWRLASMIRGYYDKFPVLVPYKAHIESKKIADYFEVSLDYKKGQVNAIKQNPQGPIQVPQEQVMWKIVGQGWK